MERQSLGTPLLHAIFRKEAKAIRLALFGNRLALRFDSDRFIAILGYLGAKRSCGQFTQAGALYLDSSNGMITPERF